MNTSINPSYFDVNYRGITNSTKSCWSPWAPGQLFQKVESSKPLTMLNAPEVAPRFNSGNHRPMHPCTASKGVSCTSWCSCCGICSIANERVKGVSPPCENLCCRYLFLPIGTERSLLLDLEIGHWMISLIVVQFLSKTILHPKMQLGIPRNNRMSLASRVARQLLPLPTLAATGIEVPAADVTATTAGWVRTVTARSKSF